MLFTTCYGQNESIQTICQTTQIVWDSSDPSKYKNVETLNRLFNLHFLFPMKRKRSEVHRPTKKQRLDTQELVNSLRDEEEDLVTEATFNDSKVAVEFAYEDAKLAIKREFKTLDPTQVVSAKKLAFEQKMEYEEGLHADRMRKINEEFAEKKAKLDQKRTEREKVQSLDQKIEECADLVLKKCSEASWQEIGKFRCITTRLDSSQDEFSDVQRERYVQVLEEMSKNGWKKRTV